MKRATAFLGAALLVLAACTSPKHRAPVEDRGGMARPPAADAARLPGATVPSVPGAADEARMVQALPDADAARASTPGSYVVKPGDTLIRIGLETGQNWRDIARWSGLENPDALEVGQVLRVAPPDAAQAAPGAQPSTLRTRPDVRPDVRPPQPAPGGPAAGAGPDISAAPTAAGGRAPVPPVVQGSSAPAAQAAAPVRESDDGLIWQWPATGPVLRGFDEVRTKGLTLAGQAGDPVLAAADGRVVYAGSGLRGYGNLVIVKHNATFLSAYAHNQSLLVKEDQVVRRGQKIAEMGSTHAERVQLHFEIRRLGRPVDPALHLPPR